MSLPVELQKILDTISKELEQDKVKQSPEWVEELHEEQKTYQNILNRVNLDEELTAYEYVLIAYRKCEDYDNLKRCLSDFIQDYGEEYEQED